MCDDMMCHRQNLQENGRDAALDDPIIFLLTPGWQWGRQERLAAQAAGVLQRPPIWLKQPLSLATAGWAQP